MPIPRKKPNPSGGGYRRERECCGGDSPRERRLLGRESRPEREEEHRNADHRKRDDGQADAADEPGDRRHWWLTQARDARPATDRRGVADRRPTPVRQGRDAVALRAFHGGGLRVAPRTLSRRNVGGGPERRGGREAQRRHHILRRQRCSARARIERIEHGATGVTGPERPDRRPGPTRRACEFLSRWRAGQAFQRLRKAEAAEATLSDEERDKAEPR